MILWKRLFHNICIDKMKALFPIKKEYVKKIFDGSKAYEYRKSFCSLEVDTIVIYESRGKGLVVGEFEIADRLCDTPRNIWEYNSSPSSVSCTPLELRKNSVVPSSFSSCFIALLIAGWLINNLLEAAERFIVCATVRNIL